VDCVIRKNGGDGVQVIEGKVLLRGGTISENNSGVVAVIGAKVTVAKAEEDGLPQTVSKDNGRGDDRHGKYGQRDHRHPAAKVAVVMPPAGPPPPCLA